MLKKIGIRRELLFGLSSNSFLAWPRRIWSEAHLEEEEKLGCVLIMLAWASGRVVDWAADERLYALPPLSSMGTRLRLLSFPS